MFAKWPGILSPLLAITSIASAQIVGPMVGQAGDAEARLLHRTDSIPMKLQLNVIDGLGKIAGSATTETDVDSDYTAHFHIKGLSASTNIPIKSRMRTNQRAYLRAATPNNATGLTKELRAYWSFDGNVQNQSIIGGLIIGSHRGGTGRNFDGEIDEVAIWSRTLETKEISRLCYNGSPTPILSTQTSNKSAF